MLIIYFTLWHKKKTFLANFPLEAIKTNLLSAERILNSSIKNQVNKKVICFNTDRAVFKIKVMVISKALMEKFQFVILI